jgi:xylulokinase
MDMRAVEECRLLIDKFGAAKLYHLSGMPAHPLTTLSKMMWLHRHEPELWHRAQRVLLYEDYVLMKLGGEPFISFSMAARTQAFDIHTQTWSEELLALAGVRPEQMARPAAPGHAVGTILPHMADELGLPRGLALVAGAHDVSCAALGAGAAAPGVAVDIVGTAELMAVPIVGFDQEATFRQMNQACYPYVQEGMYLTHTINQTGGLGLRWFVDNFCRDQRLEAQRSGRSVYDLVIEPTPDRPASVFFVPHLVGSGTPWLDACSKGAFVGLDLSTTREEMAKAVLDSLVYELKISLDKMEAGGVRVDEMRVVGGGARSAKWLQIRSDILGKRLQTLQVREGSCLGAALLAGLAVRVYPSLEEGVARTVRTAAAYEPDAARHAQYMQKYRVFQQVYPALADLNHQM